MINIPHIDLKIWNPEVKTIEIIQELQATGQAVVNIDGEGSDCETLGLYALLDRICESLGCDRGSITIHTCNQLERHPAYKIKKHPPLYVPSGQKFAKSYTVPEKHWDNIKHFGIFISRSSWQRLWMAGHMYTHYKNQTELTYHYDSTVDYHRAHLSFDELAVELGLSNALETASDLMRDLPIKNDQVDSYPILTPAHFSIAKLYPNFFVEVVCETFLTGQSFYPTEKTWRPFICRTPFLTLGPVNFLSNLRHLGFQTFSQWWDEGYDEDGGIAAIQNIQQTLNRLSKMSVAELKSMYNDMKPVLDHNYNTFMNLKESDFARIFQ